MHYQLPTVLAFATLASAFPSALRTSMLETRETSKNWDDRGNLKVTFSDDTVNLGSLDIGTIMSNLDGACSTSGLCNISPITITGYALVTPDSLTAETATLTPGGAYQTWIHNGLFQALQAAATAVAQCQDVTHRPSCPNPAVYCPAQATTVTECTVPAFWGVTYQTGDNDAPNFMEVSINLDLDTGSGICATAFSALSAIAGAVDGVAGGIFSLLTLACQ